jgi:hypothetical protein
LGEEQQSLGLTRIEKGLLEDARRVKPQTLQLPKAFLAQRIDIHKATIHSGLGGELVHCHEWLLLKTM